MTEHEVNAVGIKLPTFWTSQPNVWFTQAEAQFHIRNITQDSTKYYYVVSALDQTTAVRLLDYLNHPPANGKYDGLKKRLLSTYGLGRRDRASKLLHYSNPGDLKPSEMMDEILSLLDGHKTCLLAEQIFLEQLPEDIRLQIAEDNFEDPRAVALRADILWLSKQQSAPSTIHRVTARKEDTKVDHQDYCFYHAKFGDKARKCRPQCKYPGNMVAGRQ